MPQKARPGVQLRILQFLELRKSLRRRDDESRHREDEGAVFSDKPLERMLRLGREPLELLVVEQTTERPHTRSLGGNQRPN
jgi:hypothetical protein